MFADLKSIENEISQFKANMNSVDGLMSAVKDVCSKMDHQVRQGDQYMDRLEKVQEITSDRLNEIALVQERASNEQMRNIEAAIEKQADSISQIQSQFENNMQVIAQANRSVSLEIKGNVNHATQQLNDSTNSIVQMTGSCLSEYKEINSKSMASISELLRRFSNEQQTAMADLKSQTIKLAENQNSINQYYDQRINQLQNTASAIESKVKLFGMMTIVGMLVIGLLIVFL